MVMEYVVCLIRVIVDILLTKIHLKVFNILLPYQKDQYEQSAAVELIEWRLLMDDIAANPEKKEQLHCLISREITPYQWRKIFNKPRFQHLREIAFALPLTSAACERVFSIMGFIHNKLRNCLSDLKVMKLLFVYINMDS